MTSSELRLMQRALVSCLRSFLSAVSAAAVFGIAAASPSFGQDTRVVEHVRGSTEVPLHPKRVVVLEPVQLDTAVALGIVPVGAPVFEGSPIPKYLGDKANDIKVVGTFTQINLETIAALRPDLIIGTELRFSAQYDQLNAIAPTVFMKTQLDPWRDNMKFAANALGMPEGAEHLLDVYEQRCGEIKQRYNVEGKTAQFIRPRDTILAIYAPTSFAGSTLECAGFKIPDRVWDDGVSSHISPENVLSAKADYVFVSAVNPADPNAIPPSIRANAEAFPKLFPADASFWLVGVGPLGGMAVLDDIEKALSAN